MRQPTPWRCPRCTSRATLCHCITGGVPPIAPAELARATLDHAALRQPDPGFCRMARGEYVRCDCVERLGHCAMVDQPRDLADTSRAKVAAVIIAVVAVIIMAVTL